MIVIFVNRSFSVLLSKNIKLGFRYSANWIYIYESEQFTGREEIMWIKILEKEDLFFVLDD